MVNLPPGRELIAQTRTDFIRREGLLSLHTLLFAKPRSKPMPEPLRVNDATVDHIEDGIYRIRIMTPDAPISFNQFLIDDERPALPSLSPSAPTARSPMPSPSRSPTLATDEPRLSPASSWPVNPPCELLISGSTGSGPDGPRTIRTWPRRHSPRHHLPPRRRRALRRRPHQDRPHSLPTCRICRKPQGSQ